LKQHEIVQLSLVATLSLLFPSLLRVVLDVQSVAVVALPLALAPSPLVTTTDPLPAPPDDPPSTTPPGLCTLEHEVIFKD
jgi:hypothetical protein